ncbi:hypothetical protein BGZ97_012287 [Linnemannia gamsii]|uniref:ShKT domain-containing protein n=1 Tax=Linnemannia gamsii TaxID=64522 RepID=A0A9P6RL27_9FUNG|nr:hypothetical protein BGZ97_012287 [Linnemannia gamsii]
MKITITLAMMAALAAILIASPVEARNRWECASDCADAWRKCVKEHGPQCDYELSQCSMDCDG